MAEMAEINDSIHSSTEDHLEIRIKENEQAQPEPSDRSDVLEKLLVLGPADLFPRSSTDGSASSNPEKQLQPSIQEEMVEELTFHDCINPNIIAGASASNTVAKPFARRSMWGNFTRYARMSGDEAANVNSMDGHVEDVGSGIVSSSMSQWNGRPMENYNMVEIYNTAGSVANHVWTLAENSVMSTSNGKRVIVGRDTAEMVVGQAVVRPRANAIRNSNMPCNKFVNVDGMPHLGAGAVAGRHSEGTNLRELLRSSKSISKIERMHLFKQIVELVDKSHLQGLAFQHLQLSYFTLLPSKQVAYIGSFGTLNFSASNRSDAIDNLKRKRQLVKNIGPREANDVTSKLPKIGLHSYGGISPLKGKSNASYKGDHQNKDADLGIFRAGLSGCIVREQPNFEICSASALTSIPMLSTAGSQQSLFESQRYEDMWYESPEEKSESFCRFKSSIYKLGVLFFELFCSFETWEAHMTAMSNLRQRILPPSFLAGNPKEAGFCLWLLHPDPFSRPTTSDILQCDLLSEGRNLSILDLAPVAIDEKDAEADLLQHFLVSSKEQKTNQALKLESDLQCIEADILEVEKRHLSWVKSNLPQHGDLSNYCDLSGTNKEFGQLLPTLTGLSIYEKRLMRNMEQLEYAYYSRRSKIDPLQTNSATRFDTDILKVRERCYETEVDSDEAKRSDQLGSFFDGLCKYSRYSKFEVCGTLKNAEILSSPNVICSLSFDRDEEYFAAAGVSKKIKIFEFNPLLNEHVDIHYPLIEMPNRSRLTCVCWNNYIRNYLASTDYEGVVQLWDASTGQGFSQFAEHRKRAWSVSFSHLDPTRLASGSDDCSIKVWSINEKKSVETIRNGANVCCVQFSPYSSRMLAYGSADYKICCFDLRNTKDPWCTLGGHGRAVSYVRFLDSETLVSASTDNTLKIWDLKQTNSSNVSNNACTLTLTGHTNEKNFIGLSVHDGYISCGSETNEVFAYHKSFPMPITSHPFGSVDPISGQDTAAESSQFVSSVCWRGKSDMLVAANSTGSIKVLHLV